MTLKSIIHKYLYKILLTLGVLLVFLGVFVMLYPQVADTTFTINAETYSKLTDVLHKDLGTVNTTENSTVNTIRYGTLNNDERKSVSEKNALYISLLSISVDILDTTDWDAALKKGSWIVSDYGRPDNQNKVTIIAAHRFGMVGISNDYRAHHTFFLLPEIKVGDEAVITWQGKRYIYQNVKSSRGNRIEDNTSNLILYTCDNYNTDIRDFEYFSLKEIDQ